MKENYQIITFYEFKDMGPPWVLPEIRGKLAHAMRIHSIRGTVILAGEGFNSTLCGKRQDIESFVPIAEEILSSKLEFKTSFHPVTPFRKVDVKIKAEIVALRKPIDIKLGLGTHVNARDWNVIIESDDVTVLDTRNDYEVRSGTFKGALNPKTEKFSDLPAFVEKNLDPEKHKRVAMFCTGGIRCEKFAPYMRGLGFKEVYQLDGGILKYLEDVVPDENLWEGECFVFDDRISVDRSLRKGSSQDYSLDKKS